MPPVRDLPVKLGNLRAVVKILFLISLAFICVSLDHNKATTPATCGVAIDVPENEEYFPPVVDKIFTPGAPI